MFKSPVISLTAASLLSIFTSATAIAHPHDCECEPVETIELQKVDATVLTDSADVVVDTAETAVIEVIEQTQDSASETAQDVVDQATAMTEIAELNEEAAEPLNPEYYGETGLPIYTVQVLAVDHKRKAPVRARIVPKFYGPAEIVIEKTNNPKKQVYTIIAGRFEGYTPAKEGARKLCEPMYLNGCFVRRYEDVDKNRWVDPKADAAE